MKANQPKWIATGKKDHLKKGAFPSFKHHLSLSQNPWNQIQVLHAELKQTGGGFGESGLSADHPFLPIGPPGQESFRKHEPSYLSVYPSHRYVSFFRLFEIVDGIKQPTFTYKDSPTSTVSANKGSFDWARDQTVNQEPGHCVLTGLICHDGIVCKVLGFCGGLRIMKYNLENVKYKKDTLRGRKITGHLSLLFCVRTLFKHTQDILLIIVQLYLWFLPHLACLVTVMLTTLFKCLNLL